MKHSHLYMRLFDLEQEERRLAGTRPRLDRPSDEETGPVQRLVRRLVLPPAPVVRRSEASGIPTVSIRPAGADDTAALAALAEVSERRMPTGVVLVAEVEESVVAATPLDGGPTLTDIRQPTSDVRQLLRLRREQLAASDFRPAA